ncbi:hypothetical protein QPB17_003393 [Vibrio cholerae]|nr:hypothetical protein [Vibrio cholerae]ELT8461799.1 hypothetical protein [Vibrio cholerae]
MDSSKLVSYFSKYEQIEYVIAYGSIGRGEAPCVKDEKGNYILYNDLDLILVTENRTTVNSLLPKIKEEIKDLFGVKWVDLLVWDRKQLIKKRHTIFYFDLCFKNLVLKGCSQSLAKILRPFPQQKINTYDFYCMYQTRMWAVMSLLIKSEENFGFWDRRFKGYQCAKAILAICDFCLFMKNVYTPIVSDKVDLLTSSGNKNIDRFLSTHLVNATKVKLNPESNALDYFISDQTLVMDLLDVYQISFEKLMLKKHLIPSLASYMMSKKMDLLAVIKSVVQINGKIMKRNTNRKLLNRMFCDFLSSNNDIAIPFEREKSMLPTLLKELSE